MSERSALLRWRPNARAPPRCEQWPPYFDHPFYALLPLLAVPAFWFYDYLAGFHNPPSYAMGPAQTKEASVACLLSVIFDL